MIDFLKKNIIAAGEICMREQKNVSIDNVVYKNPKDLVTPVDLQVEKYLVDRIRQHFPDHDIIGEEGGDRLTGSKHCWLIDPIDGTTSYFHQQPYFSVSIGLRRGNEMIAAGVFAPALGQLFLAAKGEGAYLNDEPISVSDCQRLDSAVLGTGFACLRAGQEHNNLLYVNRLLPVIRDIRRCGSAAIDLAYVAAGKYDGFWELNLNNYDIAAGTLLVTEAGGHICDFLGGKELPEQGIVATNGKITEEMLSYLVPSDKS